jgi:PBP1b-binding outer membrane lipoprotein LpoB
MKNLFLLFIAFLLLTSCSQQNAKEEQIADKWNGYQKFLKTGEQYHILWAGKNINVGTCTYGIDDNANFYVTYDLSASGWTMSETHMFAGDKKFMPLNKPGSPKIGQFPNSGTHNPRVGVFTYRVPLINLPPCAEPGFVVASHCVVRSPSGQVETAWAEGDYKFKDKDCGWYDIYFYNQPPNEFTILYATAYVNDTLKLYHLDVTNGNTSIILKEYIGENSGRCDAAAYDTESGMFFFANYNTNVLYANQMQDVQPSYVSGTLLGKAASATFYNNEYYYVDENLNTINKVTFNSNWSIATETVLDTIPSAILVNDITMNPDGSSLYMIGEVSGGSRQLVSWNTETETFYALDLAVTSGAQLSYGSDGVLYVVAPIVEGSSHSQTYTLDPASATMTLIEDDIIIIEDPFSDISIGPIM